MLNKITFEAISQLQFTIQKQLELNILHQVNMATVEKVLAVTSDEKRIIKATYDRNEEELNKDVDVLKEWLKKQPHLPQNEGIFITIIYCFL